jgi:hypothetical protein
MNVPLYTPPCSDYAVHPAHDHWTSDHHLMVRCEGWSAQQANLLEMVRTAESVYRLHEEAGALPLSGATRLEVGPAVLSALSRNVRPTFEQAITGRALPDFPVRVVMGIGPWEWRIVLGSGEVDSDGVGSS